MKTHRGPDGFDYDCLTAMPGCQGECGGVARHTLEAVFGPEVADIIEHGRGDIDRHGRHELSCPGALAIEGEVYRCELHPEHSGWAHSNREAKAIWL